MNRLEVKLYSRPDHNGLVCPGFNTSLQARLVDSKTREPQGEWFDLPAKVVDFHYDVESIGTVTAQMNLADVDIIGDLTDLELFGKVEQAEAPKNVESIPLVHVVFAHAHRQGMQWADKYLLWAQKSRIMVDTGVEQGVPLYEGLQPDGVALHDAGVTDFSKKRIVPEPYGVGYFSGWLRSRGGDATTLFDRGRRSVLAGHDV